MTNQPEDIESMDCQALLRELTRLATTSDELNAEVGTPEQALPQQQPQVAALTDKRARMDRITDLLKEKGCTSE